LAAQDPELAEAVLGRGTEALVNAAIEENVQRFIFMSTAHVYSSPLLGVINESTPTTNQHPYATSHISGERAVAERHDRERFLTLRSSGHQQRNFIPVSDICAAILHFLQLDATQVEDGLFNLGGSSSTTVLEMATVVTARAHAVLGITATIDRPNPSIDELVTPLDYQIDKLLATGFVPKNVVTEEIDRLLLMCAENQQ
jgi:UDP-glucose 4-epimerase